MGVYINMDMPTRCGRCDMCVKEVDGDIDYHYECCITAARIDNLGEKMDDCPLVPVPPHGDLIDRDAYEYPGDLIDEPVIIPAEEGET